MAKAEGLFPKCFTEDRILFDRSCSVRFLLNTRSELRQERRCREVSREEVVDASFARISIFPDLFSQEYTIAGSRLSLLLSFCMYLTNFSSLAY